MSNCRFRLRPLIPNGLIVVFLVPIIAFSESTPQISPPTKKVTNLEHKFPKSDRLIARGRIIYQVNCQICHGEDGRAKTFMAATLNPPARDLTKPELFIAGTSVDNLVQTFTQGLRRNGNPTGMAGFAIPKPEDRAALAYFIQSLYSRKN